MIDFNNWGHPDQRHKLIELIRDLHIETVIEIGSYIGASAAFFSSQPSVELVTCVDPWKAEGDWAREVEAAGVPVDFCDVFRKNLLDLGLFQKINMVRGKSAAMAQFVGTADLVYVDGDHSYAGCASDIRLYLPKAKKLIAGDDHHFDERGEPYFPGVVQACQDLLPGYQHNSRMWWKVLAHSKGESRGADSQS